MKELIKMFLTFARIGGLTFGGGYAMLPMLEREVVEKHKWATEEELMDYYAIGQCTPGVIAVNVATFVGYQRRGVLGALFATLGVISPSILIITVITACLQNFAEYKMVQHALSGIRVCVCVLIFQAVLKMWKKAVADKATLGLFLVALVLAVFSPFPVALLVIAAGFAGWSIQKIKGGE